MKFVLGLAATAALAAPAWPAAAQAPPPGSYLRQCRDVRMEGQFLHAWCRGARGAGQSSINVRSCSTDIWVDPDGGLTCRGPGAPGPAAYPPPPYPPPYPPDARPWRPGGRGAPVILYDRSGFRGRALRLDGEAPNLDGSGFNDRVASIRLRRRAGPWLVCSDAGYRGRCVTVNSNVRDTRRIGLPFSISSLRPLR